MKVDVIEVATPVTYKFADFRAAISKRFKAMSDEPLFRTAVDGQALWDTYLGSYPPELNPIYRKRPEHDCSACRHFIRNIGGVVSLGPNGEVRTLWDVEIPGFQPVADAMAAFVRSKEIEGVYLHYEPSVGVAKNLMKLDSGEVLQWEHFFLNLPRACVTTKKLIGPALAARQADHDVLLRSLTELGMDAVDTVLELIDQNSLYRGQEHRHAVEEFRRLKVAALNLPADALERYVWRLGNAGGGAVARIRNTAIGTLLVDLSAGMEMDEAVKRFEKVVAPTNYKRPTALVTKAMIQKAQETVEALGFTSALERRYATIDDITINNVLYADRTTRKALNVFEKLSARTPEKIQTLDKVEEVSIDEFIEKVLPKAESLEVMLENRHTGNLVSLIAPADATAKSMFKWGNNFSWSYAGDVADSIKERVKRAGGSVTGDLCCRLAWDYADDLDFHMNEPGSHEISYLNRRHKSPSWGELDLDANGCDGIRPDPAENIFYADKSRMREGIYTLWVHQYARRSDGAGFEAEVEFDGQALRFAYDKAMRTGEKIVVAKIQYSRAKGFTIIDSMPSSQASKTVWNLTTQTFHKVNAIMFSPNFWDDGRVGNKHVFFMLDKCLSGDRARGFYNEFLNEELSAHRKVLESVGSALKAEATDRQLSGLGFSSTQRNHLLCRVKGAFTRTVRITF